VRSGLRIAGLLLAGGRSRRFGTEKAVAPLGEGVMMDVPLAALRGVCTEVVVSVRLGSAAHGYAQTMGLVCLQDAPGGAEGPLAGIKQGLLWAAAQGFAWLAVAPCDAASLSASQYRKLALAAAEGAKGAVGAGEGGLEPLISLWPVTEGLVAVNAALAAGGHPAIREVLSAIGAAQVRLTGYDGLNVNTPADLPDLQTSL